MPACSWPGTVQKNLYFPAFRSTGSVLLWPALMSGVLVWLSPFPSIARSCWIWPTFATAKAYLPAFRLLPPASAIEYSFSLTFTLFAGLFAAAFWLTAAFFLAGALTAGAAPATVTATFMPNCSWPGTVQKNVYFPAFRSTERVLLWPALIKGVLAPWTPSPWIARSCWILPVFATAKVYLPALSLLPPASAIEYS